MHDSPPEEVAARSLQPSSAVAPWWHTVLLVLLLLGGSALNARQAHRGGLEAHHLQRYLGGIVAEWLMFLLVWWGLRLRRVSIVELIGARRSLRAWVEDLSVAGVFWIVSVIVLACIGVAARLLHLSSPQETLAALAPNTAAELLLWISLSVSAGFVEEIVFRGYFLHQFAAPLHAVALGVAGSSLVFGLSHAYEGAAGMFAITVYGALFCGVAILRRSLRPGMIAHAWHDIFSGVMLALAHHLHVI